MRLAAFTIQNYRSITKTDRISLDSFTVLIGPNNEGKSNILLGLVSGMKILTLYAEGLVAIGSSTAQAARMARFARTRDYYKWERDAPILIQEKASSATIFDFEFELSATEIEEFKLSVKSNLNGHLPVRLTVTPESITFDVKKQGRGATTLSSKARRIARFIAERISLQDIPSIRTAQQTIRLVQGMVESELKSLEAEADYRAAVERIAELQEPVLKVLRGTLTASLRRFLPDVRDVEVHISDRYSALRRDCQVLIDDGTLTELRYKGDGIKSLVAMSLIHHRSQETRNNSGTVLAVEEPEAHLHPRAVHELRAVLLDVAEHQQVVITTHSPLFVNRQNISSNIIVNTTKAKAARDISEIRTVLGIQVSDNLYSARLVLLVEGETDRIALTEILRVRSPLIKEALAAGLLAVIGMRGAKNLSSTVSLYKSQLCLTHALLDYDPAGIAAVQRAQEHQLIDAGEVNFAMAAGMKESEIEDLYDPAIYEKRLSEEFSISFPNADFNKRKGKWSARMNRVFSSSGQQWDESVCSRAKGLVADCIKESPRNCIQTNSDEVVSNLCRVIERKLRN